ncbi:hypothetical protein [Streptomyces canus]|uniref:hypothetical protein n=1 Tax=Streptomyces canus TaxID=58343 RepID=UPI0032516B36
MTTVDDPEERLGPVLRALTYAVISRVEMGPSLPRWALMQPLTATRPVDATALRTVPIRRT